MRFNPVVGSALVAHLLLPPKDLGAERRGVAPILARPAPVHTTGADDVSPPALDVLHAVLTPGTRAPLGVRVEVYKRAAHPPVVPAARDGCGRGVKR